VKINPKNTIFVTNNTQLNKFYLYIFLLTIASSAYGQKNDAEFGIKIGLQNHNVSTPETINLETSAELLNMAISNIDYGFHAGIYGRFRFLALVWEPSLLLNSQGMTYVVTSTNDEVSEVREYYQTLDVPLTVGVSLFNTLKIHAGPVAHFHLNSTSELFDVQGYSQKFEMATFGYQAGFGLDLKRLRITLNYEGNFTEYGDHIVFQGQSYNFSDKPSRLILSLGVAF